MGAKMRKKIEWVQYELVLKTPFIVSYGSSSTRTAFLIRTDDGGFGEGTIPFYYGIPFAAMTAAWGRAAGKFFPETVDEIPAAIEPGIPAPAAAALDIAYHDRLARKLGVGLYALIGLARPAPVPTSYTISLDRPEVMAEAALRVKSFPFLKVKLGTPGKESLDEERIRAIRAARPDARIRVDANAAWDAEGAIALIRRLEKYDLELVEQPTAADDIAGMGRVQKATGLPVVADESVRTLADIDRLHEAGVRGVNVKLMKCGGIAPAVAIARRAKEYGMGVMLGCMVETSAGVSAMAALVSLADWIDLDTPLLTANDPFEGLSYDEKGSLLPTAGFGLGVALKKEARGLFGGSALGTDPRKEEI